MFIFHIFFAFLEPVTVSKISMNALLTNRLETLFKTSVFQIEKTFSNF